MTSSDARWLDWNSFEEAYLDAHGGKSKVPNARMDALKKIVDLLHTDYSVPELWLNAIADGKIQEPQYQVKLNNNCTVDETYYILPWLYTSRIAAGDDPNSISKRKLIVGFLRNNMPAKDHHYWPIYFSLLRQEEAAQLWSRAKFSELTLHLLAAAKPLREFTGADISEIPEYQKRHRGGEGHGSRYSVKAVTDFLFRNGYSSQPSRNATFGRQISLSELEKHPQIGEIVKHYRNFLVVQETSDGIIESALRSIKYLARFLKATEQKSCSHFGEYDFILLAAFMAENSIREGGLGPSSVVINLRELENFFRWGRGRYPFFPQVVYSLDDIIAPLAKEAFATYIKSEGHAFTSEEAPKLLARMILMYRPADDVDVVSRYYWMVCMSTIQRIGWFLQLEAGRCLAPMPLNPRLFGLYNEAPDKGGNIWGHFPVLQKMGILAIKGLERRARRIGLPAIPDPTNNRTYVHLFGLPEWPWIINENRLNEFLNKVKKRFDLRENDGSLMKGTSHSFRTYIICELIAKTKKLQAAQKAAGHRNSKQLRTYLKSTLGKNSLARAFVGKFQSGEITGHFFVKIMEILAAPTLPHDEILKALTTEMPFDEFMKKYGVQAKCGVGRCMNSLGCTSECWRCNYFILRKEEIDGAIRLFAGHMENVNQLRRYVSNPDSSPLLKTNLATMVLIEAHLIKLGLSRDQVFDSAMNHILRKGVKYTTESLAERSATIH